MNTIPFNPPPWWNDFPPDWMKPEVENVFGLVSSGTLYTRSGPAELGWGWVKPESGKSAHYVGPDTSETLHILQERGYLTWAESAELIDEAGESFTGERVAFTRAGQELYNQLRQGK
jgi:hypothetical protein